MFSSTTMASSMTTPTINTKASMVTLFKVNPKARMKAKVAMIEAGIATEAISVERHDRMNRSTVKQARRLPVTRCPWISCSAASM